MEFKKYSSIENSYRTNFIERWITHNPQLLTECYITTEKIHGANFSIMITKDEISFGKRTSKLDITESFFGYQDVVKKYEDEFKSIQSYLVDKNLSEIRLYGELFGSNIQKGVFYGAEKQIRLFDGEIDDEILTQEKLIELLKVTNTFNMFVPIIGIFDNLEDALNVDIKFNSKLIDLEDNICEGVVIKPYKCVYKYEDGGIFYLKKKNVEFSEKSKERKLVVDFKPSGNYEKVLEIFKSHISENRLDSIFSKNGMISDCSQFGEYIKLMTIDAKDDFIKDYKDEFLSLNEKERKKIFSVVGKILVPMLQNSL